KNADCATRRALIRAFNEELATRRFSMMRTLARRTKAWRARSRTSWTGKRPGTRSVPPPQPPSSGRRRQPQQFFAPTARSSTSGFQRLAANPPLQLAHLATPVRPLGPCPRVPAPPGPNFLRRCPAPTALNRRDDLNSIRRIGHRYGCVPHTCQVETVSGRFGGCTIKIAKLGRSRPGIQATSPLFDDLYQI